MTLKEVSYAHQGCIDLIKKENNYLLKLLFSILLCFKMSFIPVMTQVNFSSYCITLVHSFT